MMSASPDRSDAVPLDGSTVSGTVHIYYPGTDAEVRQVRFFIDPERGSRPVRIERWSPFDLVATGQPSREARNEPPALGFDTTSLADGEHMLRLIVRTNDSRLRLISRFTVDNHGAAAADPVPEPVTAIVEPVQPAAESGGVAVVVQPLPAEPEPAPLIVEPVVTPAPDEAVVDAPSDPVIVPVAGPEPKPTEFEVPTTTVAREEPAIAPALPADAPTVDVPTSAPGESVTAFSVTCEGLTCTFEASDAGLASPAHDWSWELGDGTILDYEPIVTHTYAWPGQWQVTLTTWDERCEAVDAQGTFSVDGDVRGPVVLARGEGG